MECDGDKWHGAERYEHDMARQRDLERAGWRFVRIRGGDFYRDPARAMDPVWIELDRLGIRAGGIDKTSADPPPPASLEVLEGREAALIDPKVSKPLAAVSDSVPAAPSPVDAMVQGADRPIFGGPACGAPIEAPEEEQQQQIRSPDLDPKQFLQESRVPYVTVEGKSGPDPRLAKPERVAEVLREIIDVEGPMLAKRAYDIYLRGCGIRRMGRPLKRALNKALQHAIQNGQIVMEDESGKGGLVYSIVRPTNAPPVLVRDRGTRDFDEIPPSELQLVARRLVKSQGFEPGSDAHLRSVLDFFDLRRLTVQVGTTLLEILNRPYSYVDEIIGGAEE